MTDQVVDGDIDTDDLRAMLADERTKRTAAEQRASTAETRAATAEVQRGEANTKLTSEIDARYKAQEDALSGQIEAAEADAERLEGQLASFQEEGKFAESAKAQRELSQATARIDRLTAVKENIVASKEQIKQQAKDPLAQFTPSTRAWISAHPRYMTDQTYHSKAMAQHYLAVAEGKAQDSPEYWAFIEQGLGERQAPPAAKTKDRTEEVPEEEEDETVENDIPTRSVAKPAAAPVSRRSSPNGNPAGRAPSLTADEREAADFSMPDVPVEDVVNNGVLIPGRYRRYYENRQKLKAAGRLS